MAGLPETLDWTLLRAFLAVAETGSLSGAARQLHTSQPTVGRQIHALEEALECTLFNRRARGMELSDTGAALLEPARAMRAAARDVAQTAAGTAQTMQGTVRITASVFVAHHVLPEIIASIRVAEPEIALEIVSTDHSDNLLYREADIAVRMYRPEQLDVVTRHLGDVTLGLFGARSYVQRLGPPGDRDPVELYDFVGYDRDERLIRGFREAGIRVTREFFPVRCDSQTANWELVRAGCGLGFAAKHIALRDPEIMELPLDVPIPKIPVWLTAHQAMRRSPRVSRVYDLLAKGLMPLVS